MNKPLPGSVRQQLLGISQKGGPYSQQALALIALDEGVTQVEAGKRSGLTARQVRYFRDKFQVRGIGMFPNELVANVNYNSIRDSSESGIGEWMYVSEASVDAIISSRAEEIVSQDTQDKPSTEELSKRKKKKKGKKVKAGGKKKKKEKKKKGKKKTKPK